MRESPTLGELQNWMRWAIKRGPEEKAQNPSCALQIAEDGVPRERRIRAYSDAFSIRLTETIAADFKGLHAVLGTETLRTLVSEYVAAHPSRSPNLAELGSAFPAFLRAHPLSEDFPFLTDLATLEWRVAEAYFANDVSPLDPNSLASLKPEEWAVARLELDPSLSSLEMQWPVLRLHRLATAEKNVADAIPRRRRTERVLIFRDPPGDVQTVRTTTPEIHALDRLRGGATLGELTAELGASEGAANPARLQTWFQTWVMKGLIKKVVV